jgi:choline dehydrogenase-like flavoprotein
MRLADCIPTDPQDTIWDVVVIGTGPGGATAGFNLARLGRSVLFLERGTLFPKADRDAQYHCLTRSAGSVESDCYPYGTQCAAAQGASAPELLCGYGVGGATALFDAVMERFRPVDLSPRSITYVPPSSSLPEAWPIHYDELEPYYCDAEALFRVRGTTDPLATMRGALLEPSAPSDVEIFVRDTLKQSGLHPFRLHYAREQVAGCKGCLWLLCPNACRNDAGRICVLPALEHYNAHVLPECLVLKLEASGRTVRQAICSWKGRRIAIRGKIFVLALGALFTPALLLRSASDSFPDGLGNSSGMIGRNLMMHVSDCIAVQFKTLQGQLNGALNHGLSLNDFYVRDGYKLGNIHAHATDFSEFPGELPSLDGSTGSVAFHTVVEDFPYSENRVVPRNGSEDQVVWEYNYPGELLQRSQMLLDAFADSLRPLCDVSIRKPSGVLNPSHMCGTCRFGNDCSSSVLDRENRIHDLDNTYVLDASFFPSSSSINPSLTIAANSLRVSALIATR